MRIHTYDRNIGLFLTALMLIQTIVTPLNMMAQSGVYLGGQTNGLSIAYEQPKVLNELNAMPEKRSERPVKPLPTKAKVKRVSPIELDSSVHEIEPMTNQPIPLRVKHTEEGGGPTQPEVQTFSQASAADMVNPSNGSFSYNLPLMDAGGYPINLFYNAGPSMDQEATMVGLGWNLNMGAITRTMRGLPDDFSGDLVKKEMNIKKNVTEGIGTERGIEFFGINLGQGVRGGIGLGSSLTITNNNYNGMGFAFGTDLSAIVKWTTAASMAKDKSLKGNASVGYGNTIGYTPGDGVQINNSFSANLHPIHGLGYRLGYSDGFSSRSGALANSIDFGITGIGLKKGKSVGFNGSCTSFRGAPSFTPNFDLPFTTTAAHYRIKIGFELWYLHPHGALSYFKSTNTLKTNSVTTQSYGTLYLQKSHSEEDLLDFNREKDGGFDRYMPILPMHAPTPDVYSVNGQGMSGTFELKRSDIGIYRDKRGYSDSGDGNYGGEIGGGTGVHFGLNIHQVDATSESGLWKDHNAYNDILKFKDTDLNDPLYEPAYFKSSSEVTKETDENLLAYMGGDRACSPQFASGELDGTKLSYGNNLPFGGNGLGDFELNRNHVSRDHRDKRNDGITYLTANEASEVGIFKKIKDFKISTDGTWRYKFENLERTGEGRQGHHFSEIIAYKGDGSRYVYGVPAYNLSQKEFTFSVSKGGQRSSEDKVAGTVDYDAKEKSLNNESGKDNYYSMVETPGYAHSFLLSAVLSADYVDNDGTEGPSEHDQGDYVLFNYGRIPNNYGWRTPNTLPNKANFEEGNRSIQSDDKANFVCGRKEVWYPHSVETKLFITKFYYSERQDAMGTDENGNIQSNQHLLKLDKIELYSKSGLANSLNGAANPAIKTVYFEYEYGLCKGTPNHTSIGSGKLTLKKVYSTYENSKKGAESKYEFNYGELANGTRMNPDFSSRKYSRWGAYQDVKAIYNLGTNEYPYVAQKQEDQDVNAHAWSLTNVDMPGGGKMAVKYEAQDYAYTQERNAMEMINVIGFANGLGTGPNNTTYSNRTMFDENTVNNSFTNNNILLFDLKQDVTNWSVTKLKAYYLKDILEKQKIIQFKSFVKISSANTDVGNPSMEEYVTGYASIGIREGVDYGITTIPTTNGGVKQVGFVKLSIKDNLEPYNPIAWAGWKFTRLNMNKLIFDTRLAADEIYNGFSVSHAYDLYDRGKTVMSEIQRATGGGSMSGYLQKNLYSQTADVNRTWIRLYSPTGKKIAGGPRVKSLTIYDKWDNVNNVNLGTGYGTEYSYVTDETIGGEKRKISSGVASYEPILGGEENPYHQPVFYPSAVVGLADEHSFQDELIGESLMPAPQIVYSKVRMKTIKYNSTRVGTPSPVTSITNPIGAATSSGEIVNEYYTSKDFPSFSSVSPIIRKGNHDDGDGLGTLLTSIFVKKDYLDVSQGFVVEVNDMAGKPRTVYNYDDKGIKLTGVEYFYKELYGKKLSNEVRILNRKTGKAELGKIGLDYSISFDSRQSESVTESYGASLNTDLASFIPAFSVIPAYQQSISRYRSMSSTKQIKRIGLLDKIVKYDGNSKIETENLVYDGETGLPLLTRTYNEHKDKLYSFQYPAHLAYEDMRSVFQNSRATVGISSNGTFSAPNVFRIGDEGLLINQDVVTNERGDNVATNFYKRVWVGGLVLSSTGGRTGITLVDEKGIAVDMSHLLNISFMVTRPAYRNQQSLTIGSMVSKNNPFNENTSEWVLDIGANTQILSASAVELKNKWPKVCSYACTLITDNNCFLNGSYGIWKPKRSYTYLTNRNYPLVNGEFDTRRDGSYESYSPFWVFNPATSASPSNWSMNTNGWTTTSTMTKVKNAIEVESKDPLNRYTSQMLGYLDTKVVMAAQNAQYGEIFFDSYEDYKFSPQVLDPDNPGSGKDGPGACINVQRKFRLLKEHDLNPVSVTNKFAHTGKYSYVLEARDLLNKAKFEFNVGCDRPEDPNDDAAGSPDALFNGGQKYVLSCWVKMGDRTNAYNYEEAKVEVNTGVGSYEFFPKGEVIDGWQRIYGVFTADGGPPKIELVNIGKDEMYMDDIRIHPFNASVKTFVYDARTQRVMAELDDNNFASFYEYDQSGNLERVKKETERGIYTLKEVKAGIKKN
jgi:hypothetical protein